MLNDTWVSRHISSRHGKGKGLVVFLEEITDAEQARSLLGGDIAVNREQLPSLPDGEFYWCDLIHLELIDTQGNLLGKIIDMQETGANDVMVVLQGERKFLVPWVMDKVVSQVDLEAGRVYVDWTPEYQ
ncbi:MAG: 16S rRNA processing protein RimM [Gammaproteobacteria bacterium]|nr:16S rRNA processing protein RimM [Gammaproteobacteria bacterium]